MGERIVVVEDDQDIQYLLKDTLSKAGYEVEVLPNGDRLVGKGLSSPDLFLLDVNLPGISGFELCRYLKHNNATKDVPVILLSAFPGLKTIAPNYEADDSLEKPFNSKILMNLISKYINKPAES